MWQLFERGLLRLQATELSQATATLQTAQRRRLHASRWQNLFNNARHLRSTPRLRGLRQQRRYESSKAKPDEPSPNPTPNLGSPPPAPSLSARLKAMSKEYGWTALWVYLGLSALDFPFCFLAVRMAGVERIGHYEHIVVRGFWDLISMPFPGGEEQVRSLFRPVGSAIKSALQAVGLKREDLPKPGPAEGALGGASTHNKKDGAIAKPDDWSWGVEEAQEEANKEGATLATQLALAYAIHKSFIFIRVPLTAAILPRVVKTLRGWGWNIGRKTPQA